MAANTSLVGRKRSLATCDPDVALTWADAAASTSAMAASRGALENRRVVIVAVAMMLDVSHQEEGYPVAMLAASR